jgi:hypothetical protein
MTHKTFAIVFILLNAITPALAESQKEGSLTISNLLAKEAIKLKLSTPNSEQQSKEPHVYHTDQAKFELFTQENGTVCIITHFYIDTDLAMDALKIQSVKKNSSINPYGSISVLAQLRVSLFEMNEENNSSLEPKNLDAQTISRYLIDNNQEHILRCITCLSAHQFNVLSQEATHEYAHEQKNAHARESEGFIKIVEADHRLIKRIIASMQE